MVSEIKTYWIKTVKQHQKFIQKISIQQINWNQPNENKIILREWKKYTKNNTDFFFASKFSSISQRFVYIFKKTKKTHLSKKGN